MAKPRTEVVHEVARLASAGSVVQTRKGVHVLPTAILGQDSTPVGIQYKRWQGIEQAGDCTSRAFLVHFFLIFLYTFLMYYLMYKTIGSVSSQLAKLHTTGVIYMPPRNGPVIPQLPGPYWYGLNPGTTLNIYMFWAAQGQFK